MSNDAAGFVGNIPQHYDRVLGPSIFADYAADIARRVADGNPARVLETAAGTGIVTRKLRDALPARAHLTATDLNPPMLEVAREKFEAGEQVELQPADAVELPFVDESFDAVTCQFGLMFFQTRPNPVPRSIACSLPAAATCSASGTRTATTRSAELLMRCPDVSSLPIRLSSTTCRSPAIGSIRSRSS